MFVRGFELYRQFQKDDKTILLLGERHVAVPSHCEQKKKSSISPVEFISQLPSNPNDLFLELSYTTYKSGRRNDMPVKSPLVTLENYLWECLNPLLRHKCPKSNLRVHFVNVRPFGREMRVLAKKANENELLEREDLASIYFHLARFSNYGEYLNQAYALIQHEISKLPPESHDILAGALFHRQKEVTDSKDLASRWRTQLTQILLTKSRSVAMNKLYSLIQEMVVFEDKLVLMDYMLQDIYTVARMLKPYVTNAIYIAGSNHILATSLLLKSLGFEQVTESKGIDCIEVTKVESTSNQGVRVTKCCPLLL